MTTLQQLFDLTGRVAVVTGAGSGLGVIFSEALAEAGASVVCADIDEAAAEHTAAALRDGGAEAASVRADVTSPDDVARMIGVALERFGRVDVMVNNAGIGVTGPAEDLAPADWERAIAVNLSGVFYGAQAAAKAMIDAGPGGSIINIASILGAGASLPAPTASYAASKGGVINLTRDLAVHWAGQGIRVNAIGHDRGRLRAGGGPSSDRAPDPDGPRRQAGGAQGSDRLPGIGCRVLRHRAHALRRWGLDGLVARPGIERNGLTTCPNRDRRPRRVRPGARIERSTP